MAWMSEVALKEYFVCVWRVSRQIYVYVGYAETDRRYKYTRIICYPIHENNPR